MTRNLKALGLALVAMLAFSAMAASAAQATLTFTASETATLTGTQVAGEELELGWGPRILVCNSLHFDHAGSAFKSSTTAELTPTFGSCEAQLSVGTKPATLTHNGCKFQFHVESGSEDVHSGSMTLVCPPEVQGIDYHIYNNATDHAGDKPLCTLRLEPQKLTNITYENMTPTYVTAKFNSKIITKRIAGSPFICGPAEEEGNYIGNITLEFLNEGGAMVEGHVG